MNRQDIKEYILGHYDCSSDFPWPVQYPKHEAFRHKKTRKWFALMMEVEPSKLGLSRDDYNSPCTIVNVKCEPSAIGTLVREHNILPAYHMNKNHWITLIIDDELSEDVATSLIDMSYQLTR